MKSNLLQTGLLVFLFFFVSLYSQKTEKEVLLDYGKMWTFDNLPIEQWEREYGFNPDQEWIENAQKAALQFSWGCSAAFVSEDGLILTNHHCGRDNMLSVQKEDEDLFKTGFYAPDLQSERRIHGLYVDQLLLIEDITERIREAVEEAESDSGKADAYELEKQIIINEYYEETGLVCKVVSLYNGSKYSLYGYKRYNDIRLVMAPEFQIASSGWDWDNFTYPRYELDFMFFRAYGEDGNPVHADHFFKFSTEGAEENELVFTVGRPGNTDRLFSVAQLEFNRDYVYNFTYKYLSELYNVYAELYRKHPDRESELLNYVMSIGNSKKVYEGFLLGLNDEELMKEKKEGEEFILSKIENDPELNKEYSGLWNSIKTLLNEYEGIIKTEMALRPMRRGKSAYFDIAASIEKLQVELTLKLNEGDAENNKSSLEDKVREIYSINKDTELNRLLLQANLSYLKYVLGSDNDIVKNLLPDKDDTADSLLINSLVSNKQKLMSLIEQKNFSAISEDPMIRFLKERRISYEKIKDQSAEINTSLDALNREIGDAVYAVFGNRLSPDATLTLRISDGVIKGYEYNGTMAPPFTTFYGMYNRYYSFGEKTYPWGLPESLIPPPQNLVLKTPMDFCSTNDIVGGNSGSSIININGEVIGLAHDGNMESISGNFIYYPLNNRAIAVDCRGLLESLRKVYKTDKLVEELLNTRREN